MTQVTIEIEDGAIPDGWEPERFGIPKEIETIVSSRNGKIVTYVTQPQEIFLHPEMIIRKTARRKDGTTENSDLKSKLERESNEELTRKIAELAVLCVNAQCEVIRLKRRVNAILDARLNGGVFGRGELKKEVIE